MVPPKKKSAKKPAAPRRAAAAAPAPAQLKAFHHGTDDTENFGFSRFWYEGEGPREGIASKVLKKFQPKLGEHDGPDAVTAARTDVVLPDDAQADYMDVRHLLARFDVALPFQETHAYVQVTLHFPDAVNLHGPWEAARAFAMDYFVRERRLAVIIALHAPNLAASGSFLHVHLLVPLRRVGPLGWGEVERHLPNDRGREEAFAAWSAFQIKRQAQMRHYA